jgi:hypothetical protein
MKTKRRSLFVCLTAFAFLFGAVAIGQQTESSSVSKAQLVAETQPPLPMISLKDRI